MKQPVPSLGRIVLVYERDRARTAVVPGHTLYAGRITKGSTQPFGRISVAFDDPERRQTYFLDDVVHVSRQQQGDANDYSWDWPARSPDIEVPDP